MVYVDVDFRCFKTTCFCCFLPHGGGDGDVMWLLDDECILVVVVCF